MKKIERQQIAKEFIEKIGQDVGIHHAPKSSNLNKFKNALLNLGAPSSEDITYDKILNKWYKKYDYTEIKLLGRGAFGVTSLVKDNNTGKNFVLKAVRLNEKNIKDVFHEITILKKISKYGCKTNLLCYIDYYLDYHNQIMYIVTNVFDNSQTLDSFINEYQENRMKLSTTDLLKIMKGLLTALVYLHKIGLAHADIKPENILINDKLEIQLIDFGISCSKNCIVLGTLLYQSPELLRVAGGRTKRNVKELKKGDIFSMGIIFYLLANLAFPYPLEGNYRLNTKSKYNIKPDDSYPSVNMQTQTTLLFTLDEFYRRVGGFLTKEDRKKYIDQGKELPKNKIMSHYEYENEEVDNKINTLIETMLDTNPETRPLAKHCMSILNKILIGFNKINPSQLVSPGIISP